MITHNERVLLNHIKRLRNENRELAEALARERILRKAAWQECWRRTHDRLYGAIFGMVDAMRGYDAAMARFEKIVKENAA